MEMCCEVDGAAGRAGCPSCGQQGRPVSRATVGALARLEVEAPRLAVKHYRFCETPTCPVVYFAPEGVRIERDGVRVAVQTPAPVCRSATASATRERASSGRGKEPSPSLARR